jgi:pimeloyl-ACP methyl ester carboxylesterase
LKVIGIVAAILTVFAGAAAAFILMLARRVVGVKPRRKTLTIRAVGDDIELPTSELTMAPGEYGLWFGEQFEHHALIGPVVSSDEGHVLRRMLKTAEPLPAEPFEARWTGHIQSGPADIDPDWEDVAVPLRDGGTAPAWLFRGARLDGPWVIHVQGIRTSRLVTLRSVEVAQSVGLTSLAITYRGAGDGPPASASTLGQREWTDLADAIAFARSRGATAVYVVAWSMGAGLALELLRHDPAAFDRLALIAPATNWRLTIAQGVKRARLPSLLAPVVTWLLGSRNFCGMLGLPEPLAFNRLDWSAMARLPVPATAIHSRGDEEVSFGFTKAFVAAHPNVTLVESAHAPHGWEANVDPVAFRAALVSLLMSASVPGHQA